MKILMAHNAYQIRGGEDVSQESEMALLRRNGHDVIEYRRDNAMIRAPSLADNLTIAARTIWSQQDWREAREVIRKTRPDIVHVQNFFPLISPAIHFAAAAEGVPVVQTLRNYRLLCVSADFLRDDKVCEDCMGKAFPWPGVQHRCYRGSTTASMVVASMIGVHRLLGTWQRKVNAFITLTEFSRDKFAEGGFPADRLHVKPNFVLNPPTPGTGKGKYVLYIGRLSKEKGLDVLLDAWNLLPYPVALKIVGEGPLEFKIVKAIEQSPHIEYLGKRSSAEVDQLLGDAALLVFPSIWYETFGRVAMEAFANGTPVIASNIGAVAEVVGESFRDFLFEPGNARALADRVKSFWESPETWPRLRGEVREEFDLRFTAKTNYEILMTIYGLASNDAASRHPDQAEV